MTGLPIPDKQAVLDHNHDTQYVRGVLHRQVNVLLGKIENSYNRYVSWWYPGTLPGLLRDLATYIERGDNPNFIHPGWIKASNVQFNKLNEGGKKAVLGCLGQEVGGNAKERKELFQKALLSREWTYQDVLEIIKKGT